MTAEEGRPVNPAAPALRFKPEAVERLEHLLDDVIAGRVEVWNLPAPLDAYYWLGVQDGRDARQPEVDQANADADRYYGLAFDPKGPQRLGTQLLAQERVIAYRNRHKGAAA